MFSSRYTPEGVLPDGTVAKRPMLDGCVFGPRGDVWCRMLLDTGADECLFPLSFAPTLGLDHRLLPKSVTQGVGGRVDVYYAAVRIGVPFSVPSGETDIFQVDVRAGFTAGINIGLLGQNGFFDQCVVVFDYPQDIFTIHA